MIDKVKADYLHEYLKMLMEEKNAFPGVTYGIITPEESYYGFLGKAQIMPESRDVNIDTIFDLASLSKVVSTTTSIMILLEMGMLTLDAKVSSILPEYRYDSVTIRHLLTHTSGYKADLDYKSCRNKADIVKLIYDEGIDEFPKDREVVYSDIGFLLLGLIVDKIAGSLDGFAKKNIFVPLEMNNTFYNLPEEKKDFCAATEHCRMRSKMIVGIVHDEKAYLMDGVAGHAGVFSTVRDLGNFCSMILNDGTFNGKHILSRNSIDLMGKSFTEGLNSNRGLGWALKCSGCSCGELASDKVLYHTGFTGTSILIDRYYKKAFVLLTNRVHPTRTNIALIDERSKINNIAMASMI